MRTGGTPRRPSAQRQLPCLASVRSHFTYLLCPPGTHAVQLRSTPLQTAEKFISRLTHLTLSFTSYAQEFLVHSQALREASWASLSSEGDEREVRELRRGWASLLPRRKFHLTRGTWVTCIVHSSEDISSERSIPHFLRSQRLFVTTSVAEYGKETGV